MSSSLNMRPSSGIFTLSSPWHPICISEYVSTSPNVS
jgi:hypothetical protein